MLSQKYVWNTEKAQKYFDTCSSNDVFSLFKDAIGLTDVELRLHFPNSLMGSVKLGTVCKEPLQSVKIKLALGLMVSVKINDTS